MIVSLLIFCGRPCQAQSPEAVNQAIARGIEYLKNRGQNAEGAFSPRVGIGVTALAATAMMKNGVSNKDPSVAKALNAIEAAVKDDGGIYADNSRLKMYETCVAVLCLKEAEKFENEKNESGKYQKLLANASRFLRGEQFDEGDGLTPADEDFGGAGYGGKSRPDLSNTAFLIDALKSAGGKENDEAIARALQFVSRCQNLESKFNTNPEAAKINDGGFYYTVSSGGASPAGQSTDGGLRSYGSMSYAGLKSMIYAGLRPDDPRVKAATEWIQKNYTVQSNPGLGDAGLFYYYHLFAKALDAAEMKRVRDASGIEHDWRVELGAHLVSLQAADGSWTNQNSKWMESDSNLATAFSLLALSYCKP